MIPGIVSADGWLDWNSGDSWRDHWASTSPEGFSRMQQERKYDRKIVMDVEFGDDDARAEVEANAEEVIVAAEYAGVELDTEVVELDADVADKDADTGIVEADADDVRADMKADEVADSGVVKADAAARNGVDADAVVVRADAEDAGTDVKDGAAGVTAGAADVNADAGDVEADAEYFDEAHDSTKNDDSNKELESVMESDSQMESRMMWNICIPWCLDDETGAWKHVNGYGQAGGGVGQAQEQQDMKNNTVSVSYE